MKKLFRLIVSVLIVACTTKRPAETSREITGTQSERINAASQIITRHATLPTALTDAYFLEEQVGDGALGPSDFSSFYALTVAPANLSAWRSALAPLEAQNAPIRYAAPKKSTSWWLPASEIHSLELYSPKLLTGRINGWVGIQPQTGRIFIYAFTM